MLIAQVKRNHRARASSTESSCNDLTKGIAASEIEQGRDSFVGSALVVGVDGEVLRTSSMIASKVEKSIRECRKGSASHVSRGCSSQRGYHRTAEAR
ncbi:MAG: hypothetical protein GW893_07565 [Armatimonadetes bacterium]|nr:hypothetical protein [Armatimonadota bacterium]